MDAGTETQGFPITQVPDELINFIKTGSNFIIAGHKEPDGDCAGSQLALQSALKRTGKKAFVCSAGPFNRHDIKIYENQFADINTIDTANTKAIIVDCTDLDRTGDLQKILKKLPRAVIDHHASASHPPSVPEAPVFVDANSPSCTLLIEKVITALNLKISKEEAELLLLGLCTDTGFFRHLTEKNAGVFEAAARIISSGANPKRIFSIMNGGKSLNSRILLGHILSGTEPLFNGRVLLCNETLEDKKRFGCESRDSDSLNQLLQSVEGVEATIFIRHERDNYYTVSLRSADKIDVSVIAKAFNGGGHKNASGFEAEGLYSEVKQMVIEEFSKYLA